MSDPALEKLAAYQQQGALPSKIGAILQTFYTCYREELEKHGFSVDSHQEVFSTFIDLVKEQIEAPFSFQPYHRQIRHPFDFYAFGINFIRPLVDMTISSVEGLAVATEIESQLAEGQNAILFANHQTEADPHAIGVLLEKTHPKLSEEMLFVAGERVITDPLAIPFSMGINLLCIYSKRYIDHPPEQKLKKQLHNKRTMELMSALLSEGGKAIYVAPAGGRDRPGPGGSVEVAPFDPQSIEMFYLMSKRARTPTSFYPLALSTYDLLPPPETIQIELGEERQAKRGGIHLSFGNKIEMENFCGSDHKDKHTRRELRASFIWEQVNRGYRKFPD